MDGQEVRAGKGFREGGGRGQKGSERVRGVQARVGVWTAKPMLTPRQCVSISIHARCRGMDGGHATSARHCAVAAPSARSCPPLPYFRTLYFPNFVTRFSLFPNFVTRFSLFPNSVTRFSLFPNSVTPGRGEGALAHGAAARSPQCSNAPPAHPLQAHRRTGATGVQAQQAQAQQAQAQQAQAQQAQAQQANRRSRHRRNRHRRMRF
eukprot:353543-Chlamydomonas_euryale.AAC.2